MPRRMASSWSRAWVASTRATCSRRSSSSRSRSALRRAVMSRTVPVNMGGSVPAIALMASSTGNSLPSARMPVSSTRWPSSVDSPVSTTRRSAARWRSRRLAGTISSASSVPIASSTERPKICSAAGLNSTTRPWWSMVITIDHQGRVVEFNPAAEQIFGRSVEEAMGTELAELIVPASLRERHRAALRRVVETGESTLLGQRVELTGMRADGTKFPVELALDAIAGTDPPMFTGTIRDITDRRNAEKEREELLRLEQLARVDAAHARDQLEAILRGVADAVTAQAPDGRLLFANEAAVELLGYESSEALLAAPIAEIMSGFELLDENGRPFPLEELPGRRALAEGVGSEVVLRFRVRATGEERWSAVKATPIADRAGTVAMAINVIEDITSHKRAELAQRFLSDSSAVLGSSRD